MRASIALSAALALSAVAGCTELLTPGFPHRAHLTQENCGGPGEMDCPTCVSCHASIREDRAEGELMTREVCGGCHEEDAKRVMSEVRSARQKRTELRFSHSTHLAEDEFRGQCVKCHQGVAHDGTRGDMYPTMAECLTCHEDGLRANECSSCHQRDAMRKLVPETFLRHDSAFYRNHGIEAAAHEQVCSECHAENECVRCHDQGQPLGLATLFPEELDKPFVHRADFLVRHAVESRSERGDCASCHQPSFCDACHLERGISGNAAGALNPHPLGWVGPDANSPNHHGRAARRDILACASCHEAGPATNCIRCHQVGGPGGNPHPAGWSSFRSPDDGMCRYCHGG